MINYSSIFAVLWESEKQKQLWRGIVIIYSLLCHSKKHKPILFCLPQINIHILYRFGTKMALNNDRSFYFWKQFFKEWPNNWNKCRWGVWHCLKLRHTVFSFYRSSWADSSEFEYFEWVSNPLKAARKSFACFHLHLHVLLRMAEFDWRRTTPSHICSDKKNK